MLCWVSQNHLDNRALLCTFKTFPQCPYRTHLFVGRIRHFELICVTHSSFCSYLSMFFFNVFPMIFPCLSNKTNDSYQIFPLMFQIFRGFSHENPPAPTVPPSRKGSNGSFARPKRGACVDVPRDMPCGNTWPWDKL